MIPKGKYCSKLGRRYICSELKFALSDAVNYKRCWKYDELVYEENDDKTFLKCSACLKAKGESK